MGVSNRPVIVSSTTISKVTRFRRQLQHLGHIRLAALLLVPLHSNILVNAHYIPFIKVVMLTPLAV